MTPPFLLRTIAPAGLATALAATTSVIAQKVPAQSAAGLTSMSPSTLGNDMIVPLVQTPNVKVAGKQSEPKILSSLHEGLDELVTPLDGKQGKGETKSIDAAMDGLDELVTPLDGLDELVTPLDGAMNAEHVKRKSTDEKIKKQKAETERRNAEETRRYEIDVAEYERQLAEAERLRRFRDKVRKDEERPKTVIIERRYMDECADFIVRWSGEKVCQARMKTKMEVVTRDDEDKDKIRDKNPPKDYVDNGSGGQSPFGGGGLPAGGAAGAFGGGGGGNSFGGGGGGGSGGGGAASNAGGHGSVAGTFIPDAKGFHTIGAYTVRVDGTKRHANGDVDVDVTFATPTSAKLLIGNGDWRVLATEEDGVSTDTIAIYREGTGPLVAFDQMPYVAATAPARARFRVLAVAGMSTIRSNSVLLNGMSRITVPVEPMGASTGEAVAESSATPGRLKWFEVRYDALKTVGQTTELSFLARNVSDMLQYAGGTRLQFNGTDANGKPINKSGRVYAVRGTLGRQFDGVSVVPGQWGRFRVVFDAPGVHGPITVKDGATTATPPVPAAPAAAEPAW